MFQNGISLGLAALGRPGYINLGRDEDLPGDAARSVEHMRQQTFATLDAFYAGGGRHFDCARSYGKSEEFLHDWLARTGKEDVSVSSKWGYRYNADWRIDTHGEPHEIKEHTASHPPLPPTPRPAPTPTSHT